MSAGILYLLVFGGVREEDFFCGTLVGWFILKIAVMLVGCSVFPMRRVGGTFHMYYRQGRKGWHTPGMCTAVRIDSQDWNASCSFTNILY